MAKVKDILGKTIKNGSLVWWFDPEGETSGVYEVKDEPEEEMVYLENRFGTQNEVLPTELIVLDHAKSKISKRPMIFEFSCRDFKCREELELLDKYQCELLVDANNDPLNCQYYIDGYYLDEISMEELLNENVLDVENSYYRYFPN